jgi:small subunit ribosomal protein S20
LARHASALKQMRQSLKHRDRNRRSLSQLKSQIKKLRTALSAGKTLGDDAKKLLAETVGEIDRAAKKGVIHDNAAARYKSRLSRRLNALSAPRT